MQVCRDHHPGEVLILGVGNPLCGDDGAGPRIVEMLRERALPANVQVQEAGLPGWGLPSWLEGWSSVFLVDALDIGQLPGAWCCIRLDEVRLWMQEKSMSLHQPDLANGLVLAQALNLLPEDLYLYGVQPADVTPGNALSPEVSACLPGLVEQIITDLGKR
jgi:hydrogenase maturation protease